MLLDRIVVDDNDVKILVKSKNIIREVDCTQKANEYKQNLSDWWKRENKGENCVNFSNITPKIQTPHYVKLSDYNQPLDLKSLLIYLVLTIIYKNIL